MKFKQFIIPIVIFLLGLAVTIVGALFKILHWSYGSLMLKIGILLKFLGIIILIIVLLAYFFKKDKT